MKAIIITQPGGPEVLQLQDRPQPVPEPGEVLIKVAAAGVNRPDVYQRKGNYPPPPGASPDIPGLEVAGTIVGTGKDCQRWVAGDKVCALLSGAGYAEYCVVPEGQCLPVPPNLSFPDAASLPETFFTVWSNLFERGKLKTGESLLVHGGSSGIGVAAIQLAKASSVTVYVTAGTEEKCAFCEKLGADKAIDYNQKKFKEEIKRLTNERGVDVILDMVGGDYTADNLEILAEEGRLVFINFMKGEEATIKLGPLMRKRLTITGSTLRPRDSFFKGAVARELERTVWPWLVSGKVKPIIFKTFPLEQATAAHELMERGEHLGKIVLLVNGSKPQKTE
jgi:NADPH2:quinone reductase